MITKIINKILNIQYILVSICFVFLLNSQIQAQPAGNRAVDNTEVENINGCSIITVTFVFPVQYLSHFPKSQGKELRVQFSPLITGQSNIPAEISNEAIRLMDDVEVPITRFEYNGGQFSENPSLWIVFSEPVYFKVEQGTDFRSLILYLSTKSIETCE
jgi:hypothetical protein